MRVENTRFGTVDVPDDQLIDFPNGIIGFPDAKQFVILEHGDNSPLRWLLACDRPELSFLIIDPIPLVPDYPVDRIRKDCKDLEFPEGEELAVVGVVTVTPPPASPTVNLMAPLAMGVASRKGKQVVLRDTAFHTRHPLLFSSDEDQGEAGNEEKKADSSD